ncbi:probable WRKY transcription factor 71 [Olea europaea var. sylvestris]|uniref:probable WRKY transcription factor 71 n=1 Tax=Olea europaea var. sylvestris TaxID=158386 RepID=UPI000C1D44AE|nr:probable WRKY transcription factor 71 [Olea europaea var. sylvestris]
MAEEYRDLHYHQPFYNDRYGSGTHGFTFSGSSSSAYTQDASLTANSSFHNLQMLDPPYMSFTEILQGANDNNTLAGAFGWSRTSSSEAFSRVKDEPKSVGVGAGDSVGGNETPATPNSSISSSSTEAVGNENSSKNQKENPVKEAMEDGEDNSKKEVKTKKKGEKKQKQPRFAFMTKSDVDHLEDGYRWRKYGQKAVKNSPYPRSYYRCTTQKCLVKKRIERSFQDPSIVITTYEGQHNHHVPATLRGNVAGMLSPSMFAPSLSLQEGPLFPQELLLQIPHMYNYGAAGSTSNVYQQNLTPFEQLQQDFGLLHDLIPSAFPKQEN